MTLRTTVQIFVSLLIAGAAFAQTGKGTLTGRVVDTAGSILRGAQVQLHPGSQTVATDVQGEFSITDLAPGNYEITISYVGFAQFTSTATVTAGQTMHVDATLNVASKSDEITVYAERPRGEAEAINRELAADNILDVLPAEVITSLPNANVADALGRMPGVTLERDEGEGKYVQIRGTEPRLTNLTIDGINVPSPEGGVRQVKLDTIPADLVESVEINKTLQADQDGDGIGGSVNLRTKTASEQPTVSLLGEGGYTPIVNGRRVDQFSGTIGQRFGKEKKLGILFGATYDYNGRGIDDIEPTPDAVVNASGGLTPHFDAMDLREYAYYRTRWGLGGSADYKLGGGSSIYLRGLYSDFKDYGDRWVYSLTDGDVPGYNTSARRPDYGIGSLVAGGHHLFSSSWIGWNVSVARSRQLDSAGNPGAKFGYTGDSSNCAYDAAATTNIYLPQWTSDCYSEAYDPSSFKLKSITESFGQTAQLNLQASGDMAKNYHWGTHFGTFQFGAKVRNAHKFDDSYEYTYKPLSKTLMTAFVGNFTNPDYYDKHYPFGPAAEWNNMLGYLGANLSAFSLDSNYGGNDGNFSLIERISAGYLMNTLESGRFRLVTGVRFEGTQVSTLSFDDSAGTLSVRANGSYIDVLPSASLRIGLGQSSGIRLVYGRGIARPDPQDLTTAVILDTTTNPFTYSIGNPALKPEHSNNYDVLFEHYFQPLGLVQAGFFHKDLGDPIVATTTHPLTGPYAGYIVQEPANGGSAWVTGFEVALQQRLSFLPGVLSSAGISANYMYTASQANGLAGRSDHPALLRQTPNTWNISPTYDRGRLSLRVGVSYNGASIYEYNYQDGAQYGINGPNGDNYLYAHFQLDAQASIRLARGLSAIVYGLNLTNEVFGFYNGSIQYMNQREYYKPTYAGGIRWVPTFER